jgi:uncharacterized protein YjbJ (UPF0337 family)
MNWDHVAGRWQHLKGAVKSQWVKLTDDDPLTVAAKREHLIGCVQELYGVAREDAVKRIDQWTSKGPPPRPPPPSHSA